MSNILIIGSSGFIGTNLAKKLESEGHFVTGIDIVYPNYYKPKKFYPRDMRFEGEDVFQNNEYSEIYNLHCLMGGMGFIGDEKKYGYEIGVGSTQMIINSIEWAKKYQPQAKVFYSSSACVYNQFLQESENVVALKESDAIPAAPDLLYGWQKLYAEKMFMASGLDVRIARFHNIFGEYGTWDGGKEKAPAALCRKVAMAKDGSEIEVWGDGLQTRSFLYIDECLDGVSKMMNSFYNKPLNIGSDELISINDLAKMVIDISGKKLEIKNVFGNVGVRGRNSDNRLVCEKIGWKPSQPLRTGIEKLYTWVSLQAIKQIDNG